MKQRGNLTVWISQNVVQDWFHHGPKQRGAQKVYSDLSIETGLTLRMVFQLGLRQTEGFLASIIKLMELPVTAPNYSTLCRRQSQLTIKRPSRTNAEPIHLVVDATGVKVYGEGEWKVRQHGVSKRRTWRKLHLAVDENSGEILASTLTTNAADDGSQVNPLLDQIKEPICAFGGDGGYDKRKVYDALKDRAETQCQELTIIIPPQENAKIWQHGNCKTPPHPRNENLRYIRKHGRKKWKKDKNCHSRSLSETAMFRYKTIFGNNLRTRKLENQIVETNIGCAALNRMTQLGMPDSYKVA